MMTLHDIDEYLQEPKMYLVASKQMLCTVVIKSGGQVVILSGFSQEKNTLIPPPKKVSAIAAIVHIGL